MAWPAWSGSFQSIAWLGWVKALPDELVRARPVLSVGYAWAFLNDGKLEAAEARLRDAERWLEPTADTTERLAIPPTEMVVVDEEQFRSLPASLATARAYHAQAIGDVPGTVKYARRALDLLPEGDSAMARRCNCAPGARILGAAETWRQPTGPFPRAWLVWSTLDVIVGTFVLADIKMTLGHLCEAVECM